MPGRVSVAFFTRQLMLSPFPQWLVAMEKFLTGHRAEATPVACHTRFS